MIDFGPMRRGEIKAVEFAKQFSLADLRDLSNESLDHILSLLDGLTDADLTFLPHDPNANDPEAVAGEEHIGWSLAHLVVHVTASTEEGAAFSSLLARGIPASERPRYETLWRTVTTREQVLQRITESRRIRLAYLDTWPDVPFLAVYRQGQSERFLDKFGPLNAPASFLFGLSHEVGHYAQFEDVRQQALAARG